MKNSPWQFVGKATRAKRRLCSDKTCGDPQREQTSCSPMVRNEAWRLLMRSIEIGGKGRVAVQGEEPRDLLGEHAIDREIR